MAGDRIIAYIQRGENVYSTYKRFTKISKVQGQKQWTVSLGRKKGKTKKNFFIKETFEEVTDVGDSMSYINHSINS